MAGLTGSRPDRPAALRFGLIQPPPESRAAPVCDQQRPIFLHSLWRSGSTYVWSRFRAIDDMLCYYEPLHDGLRRLTLERIHRDTPGAISNNRHPSLAHPYFAEFASLVAGRGVRKYRRRFAFARYALAPGDADPALEAYVQLLIDNAQGQDRRPVLGFNRTGLRVAWLKSRFEACDIQIDRDPIDIFASYLTQLQAGNYYYFVKWMQIIAANPDYPPFRAALPLFRRPNPVEALHANPMFFYREVVDKASLETLYTITFLAWAACALHAVEHCDLIIDIARAESAGYSEATAEAVRELCGVSVNFEDMHAPTSPSPMRLAHQRLIERAVMGWFAPPHGPPIDREKVRARLGELSPRRAELLARAL